MNAQHAPRTAASAAKPRVLRRSTSPKAQPAPVFIDRTRRDATRRSERRTATLGAISTTLAARVPYAEALDACWTAAYSGAAPRAFACERGETRARLNVSSATATPCSASTASSRRRSLDGGWSGGTAQSIEKSAARTAKFSSSSRKTGPTSDLSEIRPNKHMRNADGGMPLRRLWILEGMTMCTAVVVLRGEQCAPWHGHLVETVVAELWKITPSSLSLREVEGSGTVDDINLVWAVSSAPQLYRQVVGAARAVRARAFSGSKWDAFWWIYIRGEPVPTYARRVGLDVSATLKRQASVADAVTRAIECAERAPIRRKAKAARSCSVM